MFQMPGAGRAFRTSALAVAAFAAIAALSACAPVTNERLPDTIQDESSSPDRKLDQPTHANDSLPSAKSDESTDVDTDPTTSSDEAILAKYANLDRDHLIPRGLLATALNYYDSNLAQIRNKTYLAVIDFSLPSTKQRFWIITMATGDVFATTVAHGKGSDANNDGFAEKFSNVDGSLASSLGVYVTDNTYNGSNGLSLRIDGKSATNSNARSRAVVIHGAAYVQDREVQQGRSWGCPAVPQAYRDRIIGWLKGGSVLYIGLSAK